ncbi:xanthan lyase [Colletotrichum orchidophilum]|uniref:Xanthan lyase n=1 Tax=Colletotrichum orchidophilum TaxID=1209926 RepID=A0A1G4B3C6_9PEZI|nr:xanthan lyase [Colletotrichum orchidophilum]OHE95866.1 xanthan lyase [Colletotrichum orchidophilum]
MRVTKEFPCSKQWDNWSTDPQRIAPNTDIRFDLAISPMEDFDIVIYGSTSGAVAAAIQAARLGRLVALVSPQEHIGTPGFPSSTTHDAPLGGIQVNGLGATDIDNQAEFQNSTTLGGLNLELHQRISAHYGRLDRLNEVVEKKLKDPNVWRFEAKVAEKVIKEWLVEYSSIHIIKSRLKEHDAVEKDGSRIKAIRLESGQTVTGKIFVEASYEGDLLSASSISWTLGRESASNYSELLAGIRNKTLYCQINVNLDPYVLPGNPSSGLLYGISDEAFGTPGDGDSHLQAYSYRVPLTDDADNRVPFTKPAGYDPAHYELHRRFIGAGGEMYTPQKRVPGGKTDLIGSEGALSTDLLGRNDEWPVASVERRKEILEDTARFTKGLFWFLATDEAVPIHYRRKWSKFGYCRDEFADNGHFPRELYVRDARRMISDYLVTEATASENGAPQVSDPVAVAYWPTDTHSVRRILRDGKVHNEGFIFKDGHRWRPFGIAYRALVPKRAEAVNFITATCPSSSHVGYGAVRLEHHFYALGQVCANACDIALEEDLAVQDVPYKLLRDRLVRQGVIVDASVVGVPSFGAE